MTMKKLDRVIQESINRFILKEWGDFTFNSYDNADVHDWLNIGTIDYWPYGGEGYIDIWSNPSNYKDYALLPHRNNGVGRNLGTLGNLPSYAKSKIKIFDEYKDSDYSIPFLGEKKGDEHIEQHKIFMSKLNVKGDKVVLQHNSDALIEDGFISAGHPKQGYSKNNDFGWYSWATEKIGKDPSNCGRYTYYCLVDVNDIYDFQNDLERIRDLSKTASEKKYVAMYWGDEKDVIAVVSFEPTPIAYIFDKSNGKKYNSNWKEI